MNHPKGILIMPKFVRFDMWSTLSLMGFLAVLMVFGLRASLRREGLPAASRKSAPGSDGLDTKTGAELRREMTW